MARGQKRPTNPTSSTPSDHRVRGFEDALRSQMKPTLDRFLETNKDAMATGEIFADKDAFVKKFLTAYQNMSGGNSNENILDTYPQSLYPDMFDVLIRQIHTLEELEQGDADELDELTQSPTGSTELDVMNNSYTSIVALLNNHGFPTATRHAFDAKFRNHSYKSLKELKKEMDVFFRTQGLSKNQEELIREVIDEISFDNSQTVIVNTLRNKAEKTLQKQLDKLMADGKITVSQSIALANKFKGDCPESDARNPQTVRQYLTKYNAFLNDNSAGSLQQIVTSAGIDRSEFHKNLKEKSNISNKDIFDEYQRNSGLNKESLQALKVGHLQGRDTKIKALFGTMLQKQMVRKFVHDIESSEATIEHFADTFTEIGPNFRQIFKRFPFQQSDHSIQSQLTDKQTQINELVNQLKRDGDNAQLRSEVRRLRNEKEELRRNAYIQFVKSQNNALGELLQRAKTDQFRLHRLSTADQRTLLQAIIEEKINEIKASNIEKILGLTGDDEKKLVQFVTDLFDPEKKTLTLHHPKGEIKLKFKNKSFIQPRGEEGLKNIASFSFENIKDQLPYLVERDANDMDPDAFKRLTTYLPELFETAKDHLGHTIDLHEGFKVKVNNEHEGYLSMISPDDNIISQRSEKLRSEVFDMHKAKDGVLYFLYSTPVNLPANKRTLVPNDISPTILKRLPDGRLVSLHENNENLCTIETIDKTVNLTGNSFGALMWAQSMGLAAKSNGRDATRIREHEQKMLPKFTEAMKKDPQEDGNEDYQDTKELISVPFDQTTQANENIDSSPETFERQICEFLNGKGEGSTFMGEKIDTLSEIKNKDIRRYTKSGSTLPPTNTGKGLVKMQITSIDPVSKKITFKFNGGDLTLKGDEEGRTDTMELGLKELKQLCERTGPAIKVSKNQKPDAQVLNNLITSRSTNKTVIDDDALKLWNLGKRDHSTFKLNESGETVTHRGTMESIGAGQLRKIDVPVTYKVSWNGNSYEVIGERISTSNDGGKRKEKFFSQTFSPAGLVLFLTTKKLNPLTKKQMEARYNIADNEKIPNSDAIGTTRVGVRHARKMLKGFGKMWREKFEELDKAYDEKAEERIYLHAKLAKKLTRLPFGIGKAFGEVQEAKEDERKDKVLKKVLKHKDRCLGYDSFSDAIKDDILPYLNGQKGHTRETRIKIAGSLLACLNKGRYPRLGTMVAEQFPGYGPGIWIKQLLGEDHYTKFKAIRDLKILEAKRNPNDTKVYNDLGRGEIEYIVKALRGLADNKEEKDALQAIFGSKLDNEFDKELKTWQNADKIKESFDIEKDKYFNDVYFDFFDQMQDGNTHAAIGSLKALGATARNQQEVKDLKMCISAALFSGAFQHETSHVGKGILTGICRKFGFPLGRYFEDEQSRTKGSILFDYITKDMGDKQFSKALNYKADNFSIENYEKNLRPSDGKSFLSNFETRWNSGPGDKVCDFFALENFNDKKGKNRLEYLGQKPGLAQGEDPDITISREEQSAMKEMYEFVTEANKKVDVDEDVSNKHVTAGSALALSPESVKRFLIISEGKLKGDEKQNDIARNYLSKMEKIFDSASGSQLTPETFEFLFERYASIFGGTGGPGDTSFFIAGIRNYITLKNKGENVMAEKLLQRVMTIIPESNNRGLPGEVSGVLNAFIKLFKNNIALFSSPGFIQKNFKNEELYNEIMVSNKHLPRIDPKTYRDIRGDNRKPQSEAMNSFTHQLIERLRRANISDVNFSGSSSGNQQGGQEETNSSSILSGNSQKKQYGSNLPQVQTNIQNGLGNNFNPYTDDISFL